MSFQRGLGTEEELTWILHLQIYLPNEAESGHKISSGWESTDVEAATLSLKQAPMKSLLPSSGKPKACKKSPFRECSLKLSSFKEQLPPRHLPDTGKCQSLKQETSSASESSPPEEWKSCEEWLPVTPQPSQRWAEFQPLMLSTGPVSAPVKRSSSEQHLPPKAFSRLLGS